MEAIGIKQEAHRIISERFPRKKPLPRREVNLRTETDMHSGSGGGGAPRSPGVFDSDPS
jgi:hypothetical protein